MYLVDNYYAGLLKRNLNIHYFKENYTLFLQTYDWLEDEKSKRTMDAYLKGHIELTAFPMLDVCHRNFFPVIFQKFFSYVYSISIEILCF